MSADLSKVPEIAQKQAFSGSQSSVVAAMQHNLSAEPADMSASDAAEQEFLELLNPKVQSPVVAAMQQNSALGGVGRTLGLPPPPPPHQDGASYAFGGDLHPDSCQQDGCQTCQPPSFIVPSVTQALSQSGVESDSSPEFRLVRHRLKQNLKGKELTRQQGKPPSAAPVISSETALAVVPFTPKSRLVPAGNPQFAEMFAPNADHLQSVRDLIGNDGQSGSAQVVSSPNKPLGCGEGTLTLEQQAKLDPPDPQAEMVASMAMVGDHCKPTWKRNKPTRADNLLGVARRQHSPSESELYYDPNSDFGSHGGNSAYSASVLSAAPVVVFESVRIPLFSLLLQLLAVPFCYTLWALLLIFMSMVVADVVYAYLDLALVQLQFYCFLRRLSCSALGTVTAPIFHHALNISGRMYRSIVDSGASKVISPHRDKFPEHLLDCTRTTMFGMANLGNSFSSSGTGTYMYTQECIHCAEVITVPIPDASYAPGTHELLSVRSFLEAGFDSPDFKNRTWNYGDHIFEMVDDKRDYFMPTVLSPESAMLSSKTSPGCSEKESCNWQWNLHLFEKF